jgi:hypothetical protein
LSGLHSLQIHLKHTGAIDVKKQLCLVIACSLSSQPRHSDIMPVVCRCARARVELGWACWPDLVPALLCGSAEGFGFLGFGAQQRK